MAPILVLGLAPSGGISTRGQIEPFDLCTSTARNLWLSLNGGMLKHGIADMLHLFDPALQCGHQVSLPRSILPVRFHSTGLRPHRDPAPSTCLHVAYNILEFRTC